LHKTLCHSIAIDSESVTLRIGNGHQPYRLQWSHIPVKSISCLILLALMVWTPAQAQDARAGSQVFQHTCSICHSVAKGETMVGPSLFGVVGREAGSAAEFHYSDTMRDSGIIWSSEQLDRFIMMPKEVVPGTKMGFRGLRDPKQRADLIRYLETLR
jgi:cytochrome c